MSEGKNEDKGTASTLGPNEEKQPAEEVYWTWVTNEGFWIQASLGVECTGRRVARLNSAKAERIKTRPTYIKTLWCGKEFGHFADASSERGRERRG